MDELAKLFENNEAWVDAMTARDPVFFSRLVAQQAPEYLWIGCSDSRVPATEIVGLLPGEIFVHRNIANVVVHTDLNCLSVLQFAVDVLKVKHVIVCGHYGCGGVRAALGNDKLGLIDNWLRHVQEVHRKHQEQVDAIDPALRLRRLCELNVIEQAVNVCETTIVQNAWARGQQFSVNGLIYGIEDGRLHSLDFTATSTDNVAAAYATALGR